MLITTRMIYGYVIYCLRRRDIILLKKKTIYGFIAIPKTYT